MSVLSARCCAADAGQASKEALLWAAARHSQVGCEHMNRRWVRKGVFLLRDYVNINTDRRLCGKTEGCESKPLLSVKIIAEFWKHCTHCSIMFWLHSQEAFFFFFPVRTSHLNSANRFSSLIISLYFRQIILRAWWECSITWLWLSSDCVASCTELGRACASCSGGASQPLPEPDHNTQGGWEPQHSWELHKTTARVQLRSKAGHSAGHSLLFNNC